MSTPKEGKNNSKIERFGSFDKKGMVLDLNNKELIRLKGLIRTKIGRAHV